MQNVSKKLNLNDIIEQLKSGASIEDVGIIVVKRIPIADKICIIEGFKDGDVVYEGLAHDCTSVVNNQRKVDFGLKEILTVTAIVGNYSNIDVSEVGNYSLNDENEGFIYDKLMEYGIYEYVRSKIDTEEKYLFIELLEDNIKQIISLSNNMLTFLDIKLNELLTKIPNSRQMKKLIKEFQNLDSEKISEIKSIVGKYSGLK